MTSVAPTAKHVRCSSLASGEDSAVSNTENSSNSETPCFHHSSPSTTTSNENPPISARTKAKKILFPDNLKDGPIVKFENSNSNPKSKSHRPVVGRSFSDRRYNSRTPPIGQRTSMASNGTGHSATPDLNRLRNSRSSKRSLYASFKFIDDYSPVATRKSVADREDKNAIALQQVTGYQHRHKEPPPPLPPPQEQPSSHYIRRISMRPSIDSAALSLDVQCGIGPYRPSCLQKFADKNWMLFWLCWFCAVQVRFLLFF